MNKEKAFPSFFIIGAQKSATTTIHNWLIQNKKISLPKYKETHYFSSNYHKGSKWYLNQFNQDDYKIRGEVDPSYLYYPNTYKRIKKDINNPKIIVIFRKPIDRAYSNYLMSKFRGYEKLSFKRAILNEKERLDNDSKKFSFYNHAYLSRSEYTIQLTRFLNIFDKKQFLFLKFNDIINTSKHLKTYYKICDFLNIESTTNIDFQVEKNNAVTYRNKYLRNQLYKNTLLRKILKKIFISRNIRMIIRNYIELINKKKLNENILNEEKKRTLATLPSKYIDWNNNEVKKIEKITGLKVSDWYI